MTTKCQSETESLWIDLEQYLRDFHGSLSASGDFGNLRSGSLWTRQSEGTLELSAEEHDQYLQLLQRSQNVLSPCDDLSVRSLDSAIKDAIFKVADIRRQRTESVDSRIREAIGTLRSYINAPAQNFDCWIEVAGLDKDSLPANFGSTYFAVLEDQNIEGVKGILPVQDKSPSSHDFDFAEHLAEEIRGHPVAIQRVKARDAEAALTLATRDVRTTIECLNFFADLIPYNRARLRIAIGQTGSGSSVQIASADDGSVRYSPQRPLPWAFSFDRLRELQGPIGQAVERVDNLRSEERKSEVHELLIRAVRWVGRAVAAGIPEDKFLYSMIALECIVIPKRVESIRGELPPRTAHLLQGADSAKLESDIRKLYDIRSNLVHNGGFEITDDDVANIQTIALRTILHILVLDDIRRIKSLNTLHNYLDATTRFT